MGCAAELEKLFKDRGNYHVFADAWKKSHVDITGKEFGWKDATATSHASVWLPQVVSEVAQEALEPHLVLTPLLDQVPWQAGIQIVRGGIGALTAARIAEGEAYPEVQLQIGGATVTAEIGKYGVAFKITEEMKTSSTLDLVNLHIHAAARALARLKEEIVAEYISSLGVTVFDNIDPNTALLGVTTGRDFKGAANGSLTHDNLFDLFAAVINKGFMPNLLIMHPLTWAMFMKDDYLRAFALQAGSGAMWGSYTGQPAGRAPWGTPRTHGTTGQNISPSGSKSPTPAGDYPQAPRLNSAPKFPNYFMPFPFDVIVTPHVHYDTAKRTTDIIVCDRNELGALLVAENVFMDSWTDKSVDIDKVKLRERYGIQIYNEGLAIAVARNVKIDPNSIILPSRSTINAANLVDIPAFTAVV